MKIVPYLLLELVMPGGTLLAIGLWLYRNRKNLAAGKNLSEAMSIRRLAVRL
jgi:hypothetical protein